MAGYVGRFAPSPTGALHAGSLVAALASWLDARAHGGQWLVRIEDVDTPRCVPGADQEILRQLAACGLIPDSKPLYQSQRSDRYQTALDTLVAAQAVYPCGCSRKDIETAISQSGAPKPRHGELIYPGTCRAGLFGKAPRAWRFSTDIFTEKRPVEHIEPARAAISFIAKDGLTVHWQDRRLGPQSQNVSEQVGDFVLRRADGLWAYQLAVVVDDAEQGVTHIVRGEDLADNTARQILLQRALGVSTPSYLHTPLVLAADGQKLSKQNGAQPLAQQTESESLLALAQAASALGLASAVTSISESLHQWQTQWAARCMDAA
jgi:glutamyl-Q tRNA(Asp) synthetase